MARKSLHRSFDSLWKEYFRDPSQWWDNRRSKAGSAYPDFKHKVTKDSLWIHGCYNSSWVDEELRRRGLSVSSQAQDGDPCHDNGTAFVALLRACAKNRDLYRGTKLHNDVLRRGLLEKCSGNLVTMYAKCGSGKRISRQGLPAYNIVLGTALVDMYAKCGALVKARRVLEELPVRDVVSWSALIAGYAQDGKAAEALDCLDRMKHEGLSPDAMTFACVLKACSSIRAVDKGEQIHEEIARQGLLRNDIVLGNVLVDMYAKCGALTKAQRLLEELPVRDVVSWSALISGYAQLGQGEQALNCFEQMRHEGISPNAVTFLSILKACGSIGAVDKGEQVHDEIARQGLLGNDIALGSAVVDMYVKCGALAKAQRVLEELPVRNVVSWTALIAGYAQQGQGEQALKCFEQMQDEGLSPNVVTLVCILKACGSIGAADKGERIHDEITRQGLLANNVLLGNALVDMYAKCGVFAKAQRVLEELPVQDVVSWNALIAGYAQQGQAEQALNCLDQMQRKGLSPSAVTFLCVLKACGSIGAAEKGEQIHDEIARQGLLENDVLLGRAVVDMYCKCGALAKAQGVLEELPIQNVVSWNALIAGFAQKGQGQQALNCFERMQREGLSPDTVTFVFILKACGVLGLVDDAERYFVSMGKKYGIEPELAHYACLLDVLGRTGHLHKAVGVIQKMPSFDNSIAIWSALLGACQEWGDVNVGRWAFEHAIQADESDAAAYVLMTNIYRAAGMQEDAENIEAMRMENKAWRQPAHCQWTDLSGKIHSFLVGGTKHAQSKYMCARLEDFASQDVTGRRFAKLALDVTNHFQ